MNKQDLEDMLVEAVIKEAFSTVEFPSIKEAINVAASAIAFAFRSIESEEESASKDSDSVSGKV